MVPQNETWRHMQAVFAAYREKKIPRHAARRRTVQAVAPAVAPKTAEPEDPVLPVLPAPEPVVSPTVVEDSGPPLKEPAEETEGLDQIEASR